MADKSSLLKLFNNHLLEFIDDVISIFPENLDLKTGKTFIEGLKRVNPRQIIKIWQTCIVVPYQTEIEAGDQSFFLNKDYTNDLPQDGGKALQMLENMRSLLKSTSQENREKAMQYVQNLTKISKMYYIN